MKGAKQTATNSVILSKVAFVCVGISLLLSSAAFYSSWTAKVSGLTKVAYKFSVLLLLMD